ncbi:hypothetical protein AQUCO_01200099v1 [Aquilegia coerulea]|uniref:Ubiquitin-like domain-containing protein n=1 Tax=Aquilegia coerulea TaxID=218851 RepID=A0A2G5E4I9_AQUCA|nr:hypothetical protein AQUCO_01200099v1 [Aquilegia coerulea]
MKIVVRILANIDKDTSLEVQSSDTVGDLKTAIHEKEGILKHDQLLVFDDCLLLDDDATLSDCHFTDSCVVYLLLSAEPGEGSNVPTDGVQDQRNVGLELVDPAINLEAIEQFREDWRSEINENRRLKEAELQSQLAEKEKKFIQSEINTKVPLPEVNTKLPLPEVKEKLLFFPVPQKGLAKAAASSEEQLTHARPF